MVVATVDGCTIIVQGLHQDEYLKRVRRKEHLLTDLTASNSSTMSFGAVPLTGYFIGQRSEHGMRRSDIILPPSQYQGRQTLSLRQVAQPTKQKLTFQQRSTPC